MQFVTYAKIYHQCKHQEASEVEGRKCLESEFHFCEHRKARNLLSNTAVYEKLGIIEEENMLAEGAKYVESKLLAIHCHRLDFVTAVFPPSPECIFGFLHDTQYWERREPQSFVYGIYDVVYDMFDIVYDIVC